jgi:hypothetical protein
MTDVVVRRCCLRIHRTSGWAWGESPEALLAAASRGLPRLIAARLPAAAAAAKHALHIQVPLRVRVSTTLSELAALGVGQGDGSSSAQPLAERLGAAIGVAVERAVQQAVHGAAGAQDEPQPAPVLGPAEPAGAQGEVAGEAAPVWRALRAWWRSGSLPRVLAQLEVRALLALHDSVFREANADCAIPARLAEAVRSKATAAGSARELTEALALVRARLSLAASLLADQGLLAPALLSAAVGLAFPQPAGGQVSAALATAAAVPGVEGASPPAHQPGPAMPTAGASAPALARLVPCRAPLELEVPSALPFLLLPSLHHAGWLDAAGALLTAHGIGEDGFALAAALAGKVLDPPGRGWLRTAAERRLLAAFAGRDEPFGDDAVQAAARRLAPLLPLLDETLRAALAKARRCDAPLVVWRGAGGFSLFDSDGLALLCRTPAPPICGAGALHLVPAASAEPATLDALDLANLRFITDAPAARGESWRRVAGVHGPLWTNDTLTPGPRLAAMVADFEDLVAHVAELVEVIEVRPAVPRMEQGALDSSVALAATAALGDLASRLFPAERTTPVLALQRFCSLDAQVRIDAECVRVRVPLGQRHADLLRHGFLRVLPGVPWLGGRSLDLGGA